MVPRLSSNRKNGSRQTDRLIFCAKIVQTERIKKQFTEFFVPRCSLSSPIFGTVVQNKHTVLQLSIFFRMTIMFNDVIVLVFYKRKTRVY